MRWILLIALSACTQVDVRSDATSVTAHRTLGEAPRWISGHWQLVRVAAQYAYRSDDQGRRVRVCVEPGRECRRWIPGEWVNEK